MHFRYVMSFSQASIKAFFIMPDKSVQATTDGLNQCFRIKRKGQKTSAHPESKHQVIANSSILKKVQVDPFIDTMMTTCQLSRFNHKRITICPMYLKFGQRLIKITSKLHQLCTAVVANVNSGRTNMRYTRVDFTSA